MLSGILLLIYLHKSVELSKKYPEDKISEYLHIVFKTLVNECFHGIKSISN